MKPQLSIVIAVVLALSGCSARRPWVAKEHRNWSSQAPSGEPVFSTYLIGDAGKSAPENQQPPLAHLQRRIQMADSASALVFLGDNIYEHGMPPPSAEDRALMETRMDAQLALADSFPGRVVFIPGNHDWNNSEAGGRAAVRRQEDYVEDSLGTNTFLPDDGCPGPYLVKLSEKWLLIALDTQWWVHPAKKELPLGDTAGCRTPASGTDVIRELSALLNNFPGRDVLVVGHHPLFSNAAHGGHYTFEEHVFPLRLLNKKLWVPLPVVGSLYPALRVLSRSVTDITHPDYREMQRRLVDAFGARPNVIYACGHEHVQEHFTIADDHYIVSGAGSKWSPVRKGLQADFVHAFYGYAVLQSYADGSVWVTYYAPDRSAPQEAEEVVFRKRLY